MNLRTLSLSVLLALAALSHANWDLQGDFSLATNPNDVWSYGSLATFGGTFSTFTLRSVVNGFDSWHGTEYKGDLPLVGKNITGSRYLGVPDGAINMHPGTSLYAVSRFTAPSAGDYAFFGGFGYGDGGSVDVHVLKNGISLFDGGDESPFSLSSALDAGDTLDFVVGNAGDVISDSTPVAVHIVYSPVPEPASFAALGLGALALFRRRRSR